jgi:hypothetical protein
LNSAQPPPAWFFPLLFLAWAWVAGVIVASAVIRRRRGKPLFPRVPADASYAERWASGASQRSWVTRLGAASNCLMVAVTPKMLIVTPRFPFNLMFLPEIYGLDLFLDRRAIRSVQPLTGWGFNNVRVVFAGSAGGEGAVDLKLRRPEEFIAAVQQLR